jgi:hypothetical protein
MGERATPSGHRAATSEHVVRWPSERYRERHGHVRIMRCGRGSIGSTSIALAFRCAILGSIWMIGGALRRLSISGAFSVAVSRRVLLPSRVRQSEALIPFSPVRSSTCQQKTPTQPSPSKGEGRVGVFPADGYEAAAGSGTSGAATGRPAGAGWPAPGSRYPPGRGCCCG